MMEHYEAVKRWYDGYQFGNVGVYCPWDVLNHCDRIRSSPDAQPENYWINTSSNDAVKRFIQESANAATKREIENLVAGGVITKEIHQELTYPEIYETIDNIWSLLFTTGYLTQRGKAEGRQMKLAIPNREIRDIFEMQIMEFFEENVREDGEMLTRFCDALQNEDTENVEKIFTEYLRRTISIRDTAVRTDMKENLPTGKATTKVSKEQTPSVCFYHGVLLGILGVKTRWGISSNRARYEDDLEDDGVENILKYGIACYKKRCKVMLSENEYRHMKALERICFRAFFVLVSRDKAVLHLCISYLSMHCIDKGISDLTRLEQEQIDDYFNKAKEIPLVKNRYHQIVDEALRILFYRLKI